MGFLGIRTSFWVALVVTFLTLLSILGPLQPAFHYLLNRPLRWNPVSDADLDGPTISAGIGSVEPSEVAPQPRLTLGERLHVVSSQGLYEEEEETRDNAAVLLQDLEFDGPAHGKIDEAYTHGLKTDSHEDSGNCEPDKFGNDCRVDIRAAIVRSLLKKGWFNPVGLTLGYVWDILLVTRYLPEEDGASIHLAQARWNPEAWSQLMSALSDLQTFNCERYAHTVERGNPAHQQVLTAAGNSPSGFITGLLERTLAAQVSRQPCAT
eukprot:575070-Prorocentrum_minimum.AAC.4